MREQEEERKRQISRLAEEMREQEEERKRQISIDRLAEEMREQKANEKEREDRKALFRKNRNTR